MHVCLCIIITTKLYHVIMQLSIIRSGTCLVPEGIYSKSHFCPTRWSRNETRPCKVLKSWAASQGTTWELQAQPESPQKCGAETWRQTWLSSDSSEHRKGTELLSSTWITVHSGLKGRNRDPPPSPVLPITRQSMWFCMPQRWMHTAEMYRNSKYLILAFQTSP